MSRSIILLLIGMATLHAQDTVPVSPNAMEGKNIYVPIAKPVNVYEEVHIQQEDQNITKLGGAR